MPDLQSNSELGVNIEFYTGSKKTTPEYFKKFMEEHATDFSLALRSGDEDRLQDLLVELSIELPKDLSFRELATFIARRKNGDLFISPVDGNIDEIDRETASHLLDNLVQKVPMDTDQIMLVHTHPCQQGVLGPEIPIKVGWSTEDDRFVSLMGGKFKIFDLDQAYISLSTANTRKVLLNKGENQGRAWGWKFDTSEVK